MQASPPRRIAHLDMDAFYASVELLRRPELKGLPVVIGWRRADDGDDPLPLSTYAGRGVVTTCTYEARAFGIHSGMGMMKARALCPHALSLPLNFDNYRHYSRLFKAAVAEIAPVIEDRGIDEIYIDLSEVPGGSEALGRAIKQRVLERTGLTCSIGITPNKLLSKIASELDKPDGLTVLSMDDLEARIWPLPAKRVNGIGPKAADRLAKLNIHTIGELAHERPEFLAKHFGNNYAQWLTDAAHGRDERPVVTFSKPQSRSRETTFEHDTRDREKIAEVLARLCDQVAEDLQRRKYLGRTVGVKLRYSDFKIVTRDKTLPAAVNDAAAIRVAAFECLARIPLPRAIRLVGVRVGTLYKEGEEPLPVAEHGITGDLFEQ
ncbi:MAG: polymerase [Betaproteobacteria bacterium]|nr:polymerase [Betaproteobacteria bacterium]